MSEDYEYDEDLIAGPIIDLTEPSTPEDIKKVARAYAHRALESLAAIMQSSPSHTARINAANSILDRAYGKASQPLANDVDNPLGAAIVQVFALPDNGREVFAEDDVATVGGVTVN